MRRPPIRRLIALLVGLSLALGVVFVRLAVLQVSQAGAFQSLALDQRVRTIELPAWRGQILDRDREQLGLSVPASDVYADPRYVEDPWIAADQLAPVLGLRARDVLDHLTADTTFAYLARHVDRDVADRVEALGLPGIGLLPVSRRAYPAGPLAPQVLGFVDIDGVGISGLELQYQRVLAGQPGERTQELDPSGQPIVGGVNLEREPIAGSDVVTTIDRDFQYQAQAALARAVEANGATGGEIIAIDPRTGDILAMASYPWFDPNNYSLASETKPDAMRNRAVTDAFEPGSVNKVITAAAAVQEGVIGLHQRLTVPSEMRIDEFTIHDSHPHPVMQMTLGDVIAESSNIGTVQVAQRLGAVELAGYLSRFGLGRATGVDFPGEASGIMMPLYDWSSANLATIAYGQGIAVTPLQMISVFGAIANHGTWVQPRLVVGSVDPDGVFHPVGAGTRRRVVSPETAATVSGMLAYAVQAGTGTQAQVRGFQVAGKTGTARIPLEDRPGYVEGQYIASFIGFLPASDPRIVIAAILDRPKTEYGGIAAAPLFRDVARSAIIRFGIAPSDPLPLPPQALPVP